MKNSSIIDKLLSRLKQESSQSPYLNSFPGKKNSYSKLDVELLEKEVRTKSDSFLSKLLSSGNYDFSYAITDDEGGSNLVHIIKSLDKILDVSKTNKQETGSDTLAVGYPILVVRVPKEPSKCRAFPLFIWPIELEKVPSKEVYKFKLPKPLHKLRLNESLKSDIKSEELPIEVENLYKVISELDSEIINYSAFEAALAEFQSSNRKITRSIDDISVIEAIPFESKKEALSDQVMSIYELYNSALLTNYKDSKHSIIQDLQLLGDQYVIGNAKAQVYEASASPLDPSQYGAIDAINRRKHVLLHGPPGTGKSQTITGVITAALANKLKVAVVCEKAAAMEVIKKNLNDIGLDNVSVYIKDATDDRKLVIDKAREFEELMPYPYRTEDNKLKEFKRNSKEIIESYEILKTNHVYEEYTWSALVAKISELERKFPELKEVRSTYYKIVVNWQKNNVDIQSVAQKLDDLQPTIAKLKDLIPFFNAKSSLEDYKSDIKLIEENIALYKENNKEKLDILRYQINALQQKEVEKLYIQNEQLNDECRKLLAKAESVNSILKSVPLLGRIEVSLQQSSKNGGLLRGSHEDYQRDFEALAESFKSFVSSPQFKEASAQSLFSRLWFRFGGKFKDFKTAVLNIQTEAERILTINSTLIMDCETKIENLKSDISKDQDFLCNLDESLFKTFSEFAKLHRQAKEFLNDTKRVLDQRVIHGLINNAEDSSLILQKINENMIYLDDIADYIKLNKVFGSPLPDKVRSCSFSEEQIYAQALSKAEQYYSEHKDLLPRISFSGKIDRQNKIVAELESETLDKIKAACHNRRIEAKQLIEGKGTTLKKVFAHKGVNRKSLRRIAQDYSQELTELFPVFMMKPEVACNLFEGKRELFDILIVDEASQVELHNIYPVLFKAKSLFVAGDKHQMPPSNYFKTKKEDDEQRDDEEDSEVDIDVESLLEFCENEPPSKFDNRFLDFHYRSNHKALIQFSNEAIYSRLVMKPTKETDSIPFLFYQEHGQWAYYKNEKEALRVVQVLKELVFYEELPPKVMVVTMNEAQRTEITNKLQQEKLNNKSFSGKINLLESKGFAVKNLENLQGDECDILIISLGYGSNKDNKFTANFSLINRDGGYRLVNVLVTRARDKIVLITSIPLDKYSSYESYFSINKTGVGLLYAYISYVEAYSKQDEEGVKRVLKVLRETDFSSTNKALSTNNAGFESPFEEEVYEFLLNHYSEEELILQEKDGSGFRIDIVLRPSKVQGLRIAIECDGAKFHSGWKNEIYDFHRQKLLEKAGYKFVRIWSTDWWVDQNSCKSVILEQINSLVKEFEETQSLR